MLTSGPLNVPILSFECLLSMMICFILCNSVSGLGYFFGGFFTVRRIIFDNLSSCKNRKFGVFYCEKDYFLITCFLVRIENLVLLVSLIQTQFIHSWVNPLLGEALINHKILYLYLKINQFSIADSSDHYM